MKCNKFVLTEFGKKYGVKGYRGIKTCRAELPCTAEHVNACSDDPKRVKTEEEWIDAKAASLLEQHGPDYKGALPIDTGCNCYGRQPFMGLDKVKIETHRCNCRMRWEAYRRAGIPMFKPLNNDTMDDLVEYWHNRIEDESVMGDYPLTKFLENVTGWTHDQVVHWIETAELPEEE